MTATPFLPIFDPDHCVVLSVVAPVYGCQGCLEDLVDQVQAAATSMAVSFEVILVDDASPDGAWARIEELSRTRPWLRGLRLSRNFGQHSAISAGIEHATGRWTVVMDCDLQDAPSEIPALHRKAVDDQLDVVFAQRIERQDKTSKASFFMGLLHPFGVAYRRSTGSDHCQLRHFPPQGDRCCLPDAGA